MQFSDVDRSRVVDLLRGSEEFASFEDVLSGAEVEIAHPRDGSLLYGLFKEAFPEADRPSDRMKLVAASDEAGGASGRFSIALRVLRKPVDVPVRYLDEIRSLKQGGYELVVRSVASDEVIGFTMLIDSNKLVAHDGGEVVRLENDRLWQSILEIVSRLQDARDLRER